MLKALKSDVIVCGGNIWSDHIGDLQYILSQ